MDIHIVINNETRMPKPFKSHKRMPLTCLRIINLNRQVIPINSASPANVNKEIPTKQTCLLQSILWISFIRRFGPIPSSIPVAAQAPHIIQNLPVFPSSAENNHHSVCVAVIADACCMVNTRTGNFLFFYVVYVFAEVQFVPLQRG